MAVIAILGDVVQELRERITEKAQNGYHLVIADYQNRIQKLIVEQESAGITENFNTLQLLIIRVEIEGLEDALEKEKSRCVLIAPTIATYILWSKIWHMTWFRVSSLPKWLLCGL